MTETYVRIDVYDEWGDEISEGGVLYDTMAEAEAYITSGEIHNDFYLLGRVEIHQVTVSLMKSLRFHPASDEWLPVD